jgi:DUF4097 and DUF4098 domain-containing protein YvlB
LEEEGMESRNRTIWIVVAIIVVVLCCCVLAVAVATVGLGWFTVAPFGAGGLSGVTTERSEQTFQVGSAPQLTVDNFAGSITVRTGAAGQIQVIAVKRAPGGAGLNSIQVEMSQQDGGVLIRTSKPTILSNQSVQLEISAPADAQLDLHSGAGSIDVRGFTNDIKVDSGAGSLTIQDVTGTLDAHTGAGSIDVQGATGLVSLDTGTGSIDYNGSPQGSCSFQTGTGSIQLILPADLSAAVDLNTNIGNIQLGGFAVQGQVSKREVKGTIGSGDQAQIYANSGTGSIDLSRR